MEHSIIFGLVGLILGCVVGVFLFKKVLSKTSVSLQQYTDLSDENSNLQIQLAAKLSKDEVQAGYVSRSWFDKCDAERQHFKEELSQKQEIILQLTAESKQKLHQEEVKVAYVPKEAHNYVLEEFKKLGNKTNSDTEKIEQLTKENTRLCGEVKTANEKLEELRTEMQQWENSARQQFENLANRIFTEKSKDFTNTNKQSLDTIIAPLKNDLTVFQQRVESTRKEDIADITSLKKEIEQLQRLNSQLSDDAQKLASALKSDVKVQGNWGEDRLNLILEAEGLQKHIDFSSQRVFKDEEDKKRKPDFIVNLPDGKHVVIDSKVSLNAYVEYFNCTEPGKKSECLKTLIKNISDHIDGLSAKNYQSLDGLNTPDFVCMFMPIEAALSLALNESPDLIQRALDKKIVLLTPTTLVATAKIIKLLWQKENRVKNVEEIFRQCGALYDKFVSFLDEMQTVGAGIHNAAGAYKKAMDHLKDGQKKGATIIGRFETIKDLEAKTTKSIPQTLIREVDLLEGDSTIDIKPNHTFQ